MNTMGLCMCHALLVAGEQVPCTLCAPDGWVSWDGQRLKKIYYEARLIRTGEVLRVYPNAGVLNPTDGEDERHLLPNDVLIRPALDQDDD